MASPPNLPASNPAAGVTGSSSPQVAPPNLPPGGAKGVKGGAAGSKQIDPHSQKKWGPVELALLAKQVGCFGEGNVVTAVAVAMAESGGDPRAENYCCVGLWQINVLAHPQYTREQMRDPEANAHAACAIFKSGKGWIPWESFTNGAYRKYFAAAQKGVTGADTGKENVEGGLSAVIPTPDINPLDWLKILGKILAFLDSSQGWIRIGKVVLGATLMLIAFDQLMKVAGAETNVKGTAGKAIPAARVAKAVKG